VPSPGRRSLSTRRSRGEALALGEEVFGPHHPDTVMLRVGLAIELWRSQQRLEAERLAVAARDDARRIALS